MPQIPGITDTFYTLGFPILWSTKLGIQQAEYNHGSIINQQSRWNQLIIYPENFVTLSLKLKDSLQNSDNLILHNIKR